MERCVILNGDYSFLNVVNWKRAVCLLLKGKTEVLKFSNKEVRDSEGNVVTKVPLVMKLIKFIRTIYRNKVPFSKNNVFTRDGYKCAYCGSKGTLTIDHVIPQAMGGKTNFENCVAACRPCNHKKGRRTPSDAKMYLSRRPYAPTISEFLRLKMKQMKLDVFLTELGVF